MSFNTRFTSSVQPQKFNKTPINMLDERRALKPVAGDHVRTMDPHNPQVYVVKVVGLKFVRMYKLGGHPDALITVPMKEVIKVPKPIDEAAALAELEAL